MKSFLLILALCLPAMAADIYFAPTSAGSNNGTNCSNAYAYNDGTHGWSLSAQQVAGNNLHVCSGTYTLSAGATILTAVNSGSNGSPITLIADQGAAIFQAPYFAATGGIIISKNYWTIDGSSNLTIENTLNGSSTATCLGGTCTQQQSSELIVGSGTNITVKNLTAIDAYVHKEGTALSNDGGAAQSGNTGVEVDGNNDVVTGVTCHDAFSCISEGGNVTAGVSIDHNTLTLCNHCITVAVGSGTISGVAVHDNDISSMYNWDNPTNDYHHNGYMQFSSSGSCITTSLYNNYIHGLMSRDATYGATHVTAWMFLEYCAQGTQVYNNILEADAGAQNYPANGYITEGGTNDTGSTYYFNNTIIGPNDGGSCINVGSTNAVTVYVQNNITINCGNPIILGSSAVATNIDYNIYYQVSGGDIWQCCGSNTHTFATWKTLCSCDSHSTNGTNPNLNASPPPYNLQAGSIAIGAGANLTSFSIVPLDAGAPYTFGTSGSCGAGCLARPSGATAWDAGAYPFSSAPVSPTVTTTIASAVLVTVTSNGGASVTSEGTCYALTANPTTPCTSDGTVSPFVSALTGLAGGTLYHYRAFATNSAGTGYGSDLTFTTATPACATNCITGNGSVQGNVSLK